MATQEDKQIKFTPEGRPTSDNPETKLWILSSDTDGVLANWTQGILDLINAKDGGNRNWKQWADWLPWEQQEPLMTKEQFKWAFAQSLNTKEFYLNLQPFDNVDFKAIKEDLDHAFYNLFFVTHRANLVGDDDGIKDTVQLERRWIQKQGVDNYSGAIAGHQTRLDLLRELQVDFHLDDFIDEFRAIDGQDQKYTDKGHDKGKTGKIKAFLMDRPWNRQYDVGDQRVFSFNEFLLKTVFSRQVEARTT